MIGDVFGRKKKKEKKVDHGVVHKTVWAHRRGDVALLILK